MQFIWFPLLAEPHQYWSALTYPIIPRGEGALGVSPLSGEGAPVTSGPQSRPVGEAGQRRPSRVELGLLTAGLRPASLIAAPDQASTSVAETGWPGFGRATQSQGCHVLGARSWSKGPELP